MANTQIPTPQVLSLTFESVCPITSVCFPLAHFLLLDSLLNFLKINLLPKLLKVKMQFREDSSGEQDKTLPLGGRVASPRPALVWSSADCGLWVLGGRWAFPGGPREANGISLKTLFLEWCQYSHATALTEIIPATGLFSGSFWLVRGVYVCHVSLSSGCLGLVRMLVGVSASQTSARRPLP